MPMCRETPLWIETIQIPKSDLKPRTVVASLCPRTPQLTQLSLSPSSLPSLVDRFYQPPS